MLDHPSDTSDLEELSVKVHKWSFRVVGVGESNPVHIDGRLISSVSFVWAISSTSFGVYVVVQSLNIPLILQPHMVAFLLAISWAQVMKLHCQGFFRAVEAIHSVCFMAASGHYTDALSAVPSL